MWNSGGSSSTPDFLCIGLHEGRYGGICKTVLAPYGRNGSDAKPRQLGEVIHGTEVGEVIYFDFIYIGKGGGRSGTKELAMRSTNHPSSWWRT